MRGSPGTLLLVTGMLCACGPPKPLPPWTEPLDPVNKASDPVPASGDQHPEKLSVVTGTTSQYSWGHARGFVHASIGDTWKAMQNVDVLVDRRNDASWAVTKINVDASATVSFDVKNLTKVLSLEIDTVCREGPLTGTAATPQAVAISTEMTQGNSFLTVLGDWARLDVVDSGTTGIQLERHYNAPSTHPEADISQTEQDLFNSVLATVHGQPLPKY